MRGVVPLQVRRDYTGKWSKLCRGRWRGGTPSLRDSLAFAVFIFRSFLTTIGREIANEHLTLSELPMFYIAIFFEIKEALRWPQLVTFLHQCHGHCASWSWAIGGEVTQLAPSFRLSSLAFLLDWHIFILTLSGYSFESQSFSESRETGQNTFFKKYFDHVVYVFSNNYFESQLIPNFCSKHLILEHSCEVSDSLSCFFWLIPSILGPFLIFWWNARKHTSTLLIMISQIEAGMNRPSFIFFENFGSIVAEDLGKKH